MRVGGDVGGDGVVGETFSVSQSLLRKLSSLLCCESVWNESVIDSFMESGVLREWDRPSCCTVLRVPSRETLRGFGVRQLLSRTGCGAASIAAIILGIALFHVSWSKASIPNSRMMYTGTNSSLNQLDRTPNSLIWVGSQAIADTPKHLAI